MLGAFGTHGLRAALSPEAMGWWQTGVQYQMWHAIGLIAIGAARLPGTRLSVWLLTLGTLIFAGSLYVMALTGMRWLGVVTPAGGAADDRRLARAGLAAAARLRRPQTRS